MQDLEPFISMTELIYKVTQEFLAYLLLHDEFFGGTDALF